MTEFYRKIIKTLLGTIMLVFAGLQLNDPDPLVWIVAYGLVAVGVFVANLQWNRHLLGLGLVYFVVAVWLFPAEYHGVGEMQTEIPEIEEARESLGLLIASGICFLGYWLVNQEDRKGVQDEK